MASRAMRFEYEVGELVLCFEPDPTKARVLYDAKVVEQRVFKELTGKKKPAYLVHFQGWNSSWDRQVGEHYLLRNTDENRELMKRLSDTAKKFCKRNSQRRRKINTILHEAFGGAPPEFDVISDSEESDEESDSGKKPARVRTGPDKKRQKTSVVDYEIPEVLKTQLEEDYAYVNRKSKLTRVPAKPCVVEILESFMKTFCVNFLCDPSGGREKTRNSSSKHVLKCAPDKCVTLCKEFVDSLRIIFDFTLPIILLYAAEQQQYESAMKDIKPSDLVNKDKEVAMKSSGYNTKSMPDKGSKQLTPGNQHRHRSSSPTLSLSSKSTSSSSQDTPIAPVRRVTRQSAHEQPKQNSRSKPKSSSAPADHHRPSSRQPELSSPRSSRRVLRSDQVVVPIAARTRRKSHIEVVEISEAPMVKLEPTSDAELEMASPELPGHVVVASPQLPGHNQVDHVLTNGQDGPHSSAEMDVLTLGSSRGREDAMDKILGWQLLPVELKTRSPVTPSQIYGSVHLLRMFVKLPDLLKKMHMKEVQLQIIVKFMHHLLQYLVDHLGELFGDNNYIKA